jgi:predicted nucleotidyltransferase
VSLPLDQLRATAAASVGRIAGLRLVVLFGSVAQQRARADSDADIAVLGGDFWQALEAGAALGSILQREPHVVDLATAPTALRFEIARSGILLFEAEPMLFARFQAQAALEYFDFAPLRERCVEGVRARLRREANLE